MVWESLYDKAVGISHDVDIQPSAPRRFGRQQNRSNAPAEDVSSFWKRNMYLLIVDHLVAELDARLLQANPRFCAQKLILSTVCCLPLAYKASALPTELSGPFTHSLSKCI